MTEDTDQEYQVLRKLETLTAALPALPTLAAMADLEELQFTDYNVKTGTALAWGLLLSKQVAVQRLFLSSGTEFHQHAHVDAHEYMILVKGCLQFTVDDMQNQVIGPGGSQYISPGSTHSISALEDSWVIGVTVPAVEGYPNVYQSTDKR